MMTTHRAKFPYHPLLLLVCLGLPCLSSPAATIHIPADQPSIQAGIDAAQDGDTVLVAPGTYVENIDFLGKAITVLSADGPKATTIDGSEPGSGYFSSVVYFRSGEKTDSILKGFTITGGTGEYLFIRGILGQSHAYLFGGGIYCRGSSPTITGNIITGNSVTLFPASKDRGVVVWLGYGGGIYTFSSGAIIDSNQIVSNVGANLGGGIYARFSDVTISQNIISDNNSGGIYLGYNDHTLCVNNTVTWNLYIGGIVSGYSDPAIIGNLISNNLGVDADGAGIRSSNGAPQIRYNIITNNSAEDTSHVLTGGGLYFRYCSALLENNLVAFNSANSEGGGLFAEHSELDFSGNTFFGNIAASRGGGIFLTDTTLDASDSIFTNNSAPAGPEGYLSRVEGPATAVFEYSDIVGGKQSIHVQDGCTLDLGAGIIDADPGFATGPNGDHYLSQIAAGQTFDSPCVDMGDPLFPLLDGTTRTDEVIDTNVIDMGFHYPAPRWGYICAGPGSMEYELLATDPPVTEPMQVWCCSDGVLDWTLSEDADWFSVSSSSGTATSEFEPVLSTIDPGGLTPGYYTAEVELTAVEAVNSPWRSEIFLRIGQLWIGCDDLWGYSFEAAVGDETPPRQYMYIWSDDLGTIEWSVSSPANWVVLDPTSGSSSGEKDLVYVSIDHSGLLVGKYDSEIIIEAPGAANSPLSIPVSLTVGQMVIDHSPASFSFDAIVENDPPAPDELRIRNEGFGRMDWSVSCPAFWLSLYPDSGISGGENDYVSVEVEHGALPAGTYSSTITIEAPGALNTPQLIPVQLTVHPLEIGFQPASLTYHCEFMGNPPPDQSLDVWNAGPGWMYWRLSTNVDWLSLGQWAGWSSGEHDEIQISADQTGLQPGTHLATITIEADGASNSPQFVPVTLVVGDSNRVSRLITGPGPAQANPSLVRVFPPEQDAAAIYEFTAYATPGYGANVSTARLDVDPFDEILTGPGPGEVYGPHVRGFELDGTPLPGLSFLAYGTNKYGVNVAGGELDGDGYDEIVTGAGPGAVFGPHVRAFDYDGTPGVSPMRGVSFFAYGTPKWGVNVAAGDIDGDGLDEIVTGPGPGAVYGPHVRAWNVDGGPVAAIPGVSFLAYGTNKYGVHVTAGDVDGDGIDEIVTGAGPGVVFGPHVRGWNYDGTVVTSLPGYSFFAWQTAPLTHGVNVFAGADLNSDGRDEVVAGRGPAPTADTEVKVFTYDGSVVTQWISLEAYPGLYQGTNVAAGWF